jgi:hypothetical protein
VHWFISSILPVDVCTTLTDPSSHLRLKLHATSDCVSPTERMRASAELNTASLFNQPTQHLLFWCRHKSVVQRLNIKLVRYSIGPRKPKQLPSVSPFSPTKNFFEIQYRIVYFTGYFHQVQVAWVAHMPLSQARSCKLPQWHQMEPSYIYICEWMLPRTWYHVCVVRELLNIDSCQSVTNRQKVPKNVKKSATALLLAQWWRRCNLERLSSKGYASKAVTTTS